MVATKDAMKCSAVGNRPMTNSSFKAPSNVLPRPDVNVRIADVPKVLSVSYTRKNTAFDGAACNGELCQQEKHMSWMNKT